MAVVTRCIIRIIIGAIVPVVGVALLGTLLYSPAPPGPTPPGHFYEHLTLGEALVMRILPISVIFIIPGAIFGGMLGSNWRSAKPPRAD